METKRLILRNIEERDLQDIFELYANEEVVKYTPLERFISQDDALQEMNWHSEIFRQQMGLRWVIEEKLTGKMIGSCGYMNYLEALSRVDIGYDLAPCYWGKGIMTEAASPILAFGFDRMGINRMEAQVDPANEASIRLLSKLGFNHEGKRREYECEKGKFTDLFVYSLLRSQYEQQHKHIHSASSVFLI